MSSTEVVIEVEQQVGSFSVEGWEHLAAEFLCVVVVFKGLCCLVPVGES